MLAIAAATITALTVALPAQQPAPGLRLYQPLGNQLTSLVDSNGAVLRSWPGGPHVTAHMLADGSLLRGLQVAAQFIGGETGRLQRIGFDGTLLWDYQLSGPDYYLHHDLEPMPNGNVLVIAWDGDTPADAIAAGRDPALISGARWLPDSILEIQPTGPNSGAIVWEWHVMDHLVQDFDPTKANYGVVADHPELIDINYPPVAISDGDWNHCNGLDYDPVHDWIVLSARQQSEIYIIDHSTTTAEAAGHVGGARGRGGDILYRWGNPEAYRRGTAADRQLLTQHDPRFVAAGYPGAGNVTVFNNEYVLSTQSAVLEIALPIGPTGGFSPDPVTGQYGPAAPTWSYSDPTFYSQFISSAERLPNGNTLICSGQQFEVFEVDPAGTKIWSHAHDPGSANSFGVFQAHYVERSLWANSATLSTRGDIVGFRHLLGTPRANTFCMLLGSLTGTSPGTELAPGVHLPLNPDVLTSAMATQFNTGIFVGTLSTLDLQGANTSSLIVGPGLIPPALTGIELNFAHVVFDSGFAPVHASNAVPVTIVP